MNEADLWSAAGVAVEHQVFFIHHACILVFPFGAVIQSSCQGSNLKRPALNGMNRDAQDEMVRRQGVSPHSQRFTAKVRRVSLH